MKRHAEKPPKLYTDRVIPDGLIKPRLPDINRVALCLPDDLADAIRAFIEATEDEFNELLRSAGKSNFDIYKMIDHKNEEAT